MAELLTQNYWVFEYYVAEDREARKANKGRWFQLNPDGTYESGHWQKLTGYGVWRLQDDPEEGFLLVFDNVNDALDEQWEIQGVNEDKDTMSWGGVNKTPNAGIITKTISLLSRPTRAQFGVQ